MKKILSLIIAICFFFLSGHAQKTERPPMWGIAKMTFYVTDFSGVDKYYGEFLGFDKAFLYASPAGEVVSYKVNDRQFLEFVKRPNSLKKNRLAKLSFDCDEIEEMHKYLLEKDVKIIEKPYQDEAGNKVLIVESPSNYQIEFIKFMPGSLHKKSKGKFLSENRVSKRIHHAGLHVSDVALNDFFYRDILGFKDMWRFKESNDAKPNYIYLRMPDCVENIEYIVTDDKFSSHPCLLFEDMQEAIYTLKERADGIKIPKPMIGKGKRWLLNMRNSEGLRVEFTEANTVR